MSNALRSARFSEELRPLSGTLSGNLKQASDHRTTEFVSTPVAPSEPSATSTFKCTHPGCAAPPFHTRYLLHSHAKVHRESRPYFCPVKGCPRAAGGKGFKIKNDMIRHGRVHDSRGYTCPFCADQQHRYPRPDNLMRYAIVHFGGDMLEAPC
jgi:hypothetical protein